MKIKGLVKNIDVDGYERLLTIQTDDRLIWCNVVQPNEYLEPGQSSMYLKMGAPVQLKVGLFFVGNHRVIIGRDDRGMIQDVHGSPHAIVIGEVIGKIASDIYLIEIDESDQIEAQFESDVDLNIGDYIRVEGELAV
jgi:hypothetical protein